MRKLRIIKYLQDLDLKFHSHLGLWRIHKITKFLNNIAVEKIHIGDIYP